MRFRICDRRRKLFLIILSLVFCLCWGCNGDDDGDDNDASSDYFPNADGTQWNYDVTDYTENTTFSAATTITGTSQYAGTTCQVLIDTVEVDPGFQTRRYAVDSGSRVMVYGFEEYRDGELQLSHIFPSAIVQFVYEFTVGQTWDVVRLFGILPTDWSPEMEDDIDGDGVADTLDIIYTASVPSQGSQTVPAGTFDTYLLVYHMDATFHTSSYGDFNLAGDISRAWFSPYVGVVKAEDYNIETGQLEEKTELRSYYLGP